MIVCEKIKKFTNRPRKVTPEQEAELIQLYRHGGLAATAELTAQYGISPKYPANVAAVMGIKRPRWRKGNRYVDNNVDRSVRTVKDPRWARARAIGTVIA